MIVPIKRRGSVAGVDQHHLESALLKQFVGGLSRRSGLAGFSVAG
jgi:hypothetical protein